MKRSRWHSVFFFVLILLQSLAATAQNGFAYKAKLDTVLQSGFYTLSLSPAIIAKCKNDISDVRIKDNSNIEVPYILYTETARLNAESFTEFPVTFSDDRKNLIINNILPNSISRLFLLIKNSEAQRIATLSGSDDAAHWFVIKENIVLQNEYTADKDEFVQSVSFPPSSYKYFKISMTSKNILPLNITKAGVYRQSFSGNAYDTIPFPVIFQKDSSDKRSYVYLSFNESYEIDKLNLFFSGVKYYKRAVAVYNKNTVNASIADDTVFSAKPAGIELHVKTNRLLVMINNGDNAPLSVQNAVVLQLHTTVTAYLESGKNYALYFSDSNATVPAYDLQYFSDSIGSNIHSLTLQRIEKTAAAPLVAKEENGANKWILWSLIIAVLALLVYFSFRMMKDINNKTNSDAHL